MNRDEQLTMYTIHADMHFTSLKIYDRAYMFYFTAITASAVLLVVGGESPHPFTAMVWVVNALACVHAALTCRHWVTVVNASANLLHSYEAQLGVSRALRPRLSALRSDITFGMLGLFCLVQGIVVAVQLYRGA